MRIWIMLLWLLISAAGWTQGTTSPEQGCRDNLHALMRALTQYARDHAGAYPENLEKLVPRYLPQLPHCPAAGSDTYSRYSVVLLSPPRATLICNYPSHRCDPPDYLVVSSDRGEESPFARQADPAICRTTLLTLAQRLQEEKERSGRYPAELESPPRCSCGDPVGYRCAEDGQNFFAFCPGAAHLGSGLAPYSPQITGQGLHEESLLLTPPQGAPRRASLSPLMLGAAAAALAVLLLLLWQTWNRRRPVRID